MKKGDKGKEREDPEVEFRPYSRTAKRPVAQASKPINLQRTKKRTGTRASGSVETEVKNVKKEIIQKKTIQAEKISKSITTAELNKIRMEAAEKQKKDDKDYIVELNSHLKILFKDVVPENLIKKVIDDKMGIWMQAYTHATYCVDRYTLKDGQMEQIGDYEELELVGDKILAGVFSMILINKFPNMKNDELSQLIMYYMSKQEGAQGDIGEKLHFQDYIRMGTDIRGHKSEINQEIVADVFESIFGALGIIGEKIRRGLGYVLCELFLQKILPVDKINEKRAQQNTKTVYSQTFARLKPFGIEDDKKIPGQTVYTLYFPTQNIPDMLKSDETKIVRLAKKLDSQKKTMSTEDKKTGVITKREVVVIGVGVSTSKKMATRQAYDKAKLTFSEAGVENEDLIRFRRLKDRRASFEIDRLWGQADTLARNENYTVKQIKVGAKLNAVSGTTTIMLIGEDLRTGKEVKLAYLYTDGKDTSPSNTDTKIELFKLYLRNRYGVEPDNYDEE